MKSRRKTSPIAKTVAAVCCVALGFGLAKATPGVQTEGTGTQFGWQLAANDSQASFLTGDGRRFGGDLAERETPKPNFIETTAASSEKLAPNRVAELERLAEPAEFDDSSELALEDVAVAANAASESEISGDEYDRIWLENSELEKWANWGAETKLPEAVPNAVFADADVPDWNVSEPTFDADAALAFAVETPSLADPALARWSVNADLGSDSAFYQETKTSVLGGERQNREQNSNDVAATRSTKNQNDGGAIYVTRSGVGCYVAAGTFGSASGTTTK